MAAILLPHELQNLVWDARTAIPPCTLSLEKTRKTTKSPTIPTPTTPAISRGSAKITKLVPGPIVLVAIELIEVVLDENVDAVAGIFAVVAVVTIAAEAPGVVAIET